MAPANQSASATDCFPRRSVIAALVILAAGCNGEPEPFRSKDKDQARKAMLNKREDLKRPPGLPKKVSGTR